MQFGLFCICFLGNSVCFGFVFKGSRSVFRELGSCRLVFRELGLIRFVFREVGSWLSLFLGN